MPFTIINPAFRNGEIIPTRYTRDGENRSPPLEWRDALLETCSTGDLQLRVDRRGSRCSVGDIPALGAVQHPRE